MFKLVSNFKPTGDQPEAIKKLVKNLKSGAKYQVLLGVTGSGKTFTMAKVIEKIQDLLGINELTKLRKQVIKGANKALESMV